MASQRARYDVEFVPDWTGDGGAEMALGEPYLGSGIAGRNGAGRTDVFFSESLY